MTRHGKLIRLDSIAHFAGDKKCGLWLYPNTNNELITILRFQYAFNERGPYLVRETEIYGMLVAWDLNSCVLMMKVVDRGRGVPYAGVKPVYLDSTKGNAVDLTNPEGHLVYTFRRLSGQYLL